MSAAQPFSDNELRRLRIALKAKRLSVDEVLGYGGMGVVLKGYDLEVNRDIAIKVIRPGLLDDPRALEQFQNEMEILGQLHHAAIVSVFGAGVVRESPYFTMSYVAGESLDAALQHRGELGDPFTAQETAELLRPIAYALDYLHSRPTPVFHRDVKPSNILIPAADSTFSEAAVLADFGISSIQEQFIERDSVVVGTEPYLAPEWFTWNGRSAMGAPPSEFSDQYALAVTAFEMMTLRTPMHQMTREQWRYQRSPVNMRRVNFARADSGRIRALKEVFEQGLSLEPTERFRTCTSLIDALYHAPENRKPLQPAGLPVAGAKKADGASKVIYVKKGQPLWKRALLWIFALMAFPVVLVLLSQGLVAIT